MGLLSHKPKVSIEEFCRQFYDSFVFNATIGGVDLNEVLCKTFFDSIVEADQSFAEIDRDKFRNEMIAIRMELFGLAWLHKFKKEELAISQSLFTRRYLEENGRIEIWEAMGAYNQAIARSSITTVKQDPDGRRRFTQIDDDLLVARMNKARFDICTKWAESNLPKPELMTEKDKITLACAVRVANRFGVDAKRFSSITVPLLASRLADRLGCDISIDFDALFRLGAFIFGFYEGAKEGLRDANILVGVKDIKTAQPEALLIGKDIPFKAIEKEFCRVISFKPFASVVNGEVKAASKVMPYAFLSLESPVLPKGKECILGIVHRIDFSHLWEAFKVRGIDNNKEEVLIAYVSSYRNIWLKLFSSVHPKLHVYIFPIGHLEQCYDRNFKPANPSIWWKSIAEWGPPEDWH
jgi:hypothetical protein